MPLIIPYCRMQSPSPNVSQAPSTPNNVVSTAIVVSAPNNENASAAISVGNHQIFHQPPPAPNELVIKAILEQNRTLNETNHSLNDTIRTLMEQLNILALTNKTLVEQMNEMRKESYDLIQQASMRLLEERKQNAPVVSIQAPSTASVQNPVSSTFGQSTGSSVFGQNTGSFGQNVASPGLKFAQEAKETPPQNLPKKDETFVDFAGTVVKSNVADKKAPQPSVIKAPILPNSSKPTKDASQQPSTIFGQNVASSGFTFSQIAAKQTSPSPTAQEKKPGPFSGFTGFVGAGQPVFSTTPPQRETTRQLSESYEDGEGGAENFEPSVNFQPLIPLPALVEVKTGEEGETVLYKERAKLFRFDTELNEFKERGLGELKILKNPTTGKVRLLMRREQVLKICANHAITEDMKLAPMAKSDRALTWKCMDFSDGELKSETLAAKFKSPEMAKSFKDAFEKCAKNLAANEGKTVTPNNTPATLSAASSTTNLPKTVETLGDFAGAVKPNVADKKALQTSVIKAPLLPDPSKAAKDASQQPSTIFGQNVASSGFTFAQIAAKQTSPSPTAQEKKPGPFSGFTGFVGAGQPVFSTTPPQRETTRQLSESYEDGEGGAENFEPSVNFQPLIPLPALVEVKTGEEGETVLYKERAKLFRFDTELNEFKERGLGELKILKNPTTGKVRLLMRREQVLKICANHAITEDMKLAPMAKSDRAFTWMCMDFSDGELKSETLAAKFKSPEVAKSFKEAFEKCTKNVGGNEKKVMPNNTPVQVQAQNLPKSGETLGDLSGTGKQIVADKKEPQISMIKPPLLPDTAKAAKDASHQPSTIFGQNVASSGFTFAQIAAKQTSPSPTAQEKKPGPFSGFTGFAGAGQPIFATSPQQRETARQLSESYEDGEGGAENFEPSVNFQPLIPLPALVEVKTGEEGETVLYKERAKLFRFDTELSEFKERGLGELKILKNPTTGKVRLLMRREQVLKICANHAITEDMKLAPMAKSDRAFTWKCMDFSDGELKSETLAAKFKSPEVAKSFKDAFEKCAKNLAANEEKTVTPNNTPASLSAASSTTNLPATGFGEKFKPAPGSWDCKVCYVRNDQKATSCISCQTPKQDQQLQSPLPAKPAATTTTTTTNASPVNFKFVLPATSSTPETPKSTATKPKFGFTAGGSIFGDLGNAQKPVFGASSVSTTSTGGFKFGFAAEKKDEAKVETVQVVGAGGKEIQGDDVEITHEARASSEEKRCAEKFRLPANFYLYEKKAACPGCVGCKSDEELDSVFDQLNSRIGSGAPDDSNDDGSSEEGKLLFQKNATLLTKFGDTFKPVAVGEILAVYDEDVDAYRLKFMNVDSAALLMDHLIAQPSDYKSIKGKKGQFVAQWSAPDWASDPAKATPKTFQLKFSSELALKEFEEVFRQGIEIARNNCIFYEQPAGNYSTESKSTEQTLVLQGLMKSMAAFKPDKSPNSREPEE